MNVLGKNFILYAWEGGVWIGYACSLDISFDISTEFIETSVSGKGLMATYLPTKNSFTANATGIVALEEAGLLCYPDLQAKQLAHELMLLRFQETDEGGNVYTKECSMFISNSSETGSFGGMDNFSIDFRGTGIITQIFTPQPPIPEDAVQVERYEYTAAGGEEGFTDSDLIGKEILEFNKDGIGFSPIITSGTPINKEVKYISATGEFLTGVGEWEAGEEIYILYQDL